MRAPIGQRIRKRRQELALTQSALAARVGISSSYLNLIEHNKRAIGGAILHRIAETLELDSRALAGTEEARLIAELAEVFADSALAGVDLGHDGAREIVATSPVAARAILALYRAYGEARLRSDMIGARLGEDSFLAEASNQILSLITTIRSYSEILEDYGDLPEAQRRRFVSTLVAESERLAKNAGDMFDFMSGRGRGRPRPSPREEIEDFISDRANYFPLIEAAAETTGAGFGGPPTLEALAAHLLRRHAIGIERAPGGTLPPSGEDFDSSRRVLRFADALSHRSVRFRLARRLADREQETLLDRLAEAAALSTNEASLRLKRALANYFAGALIMPYAGFRRAAAESRHDIARLAAGFDASFEQVCHRLATLQRPSAEGVPMHFLRTDIAGNISKRFSASGIRLPRYGGACPRWIVHHAFAAPGRIVSQVARLPDGQAYLFVAGATMPAAGLGPCHSVMIGAALIHARRFVYADGLDLGAPALAVPVGVTCRQCPREDCAERAAEALALPGTAADDRNGRER